MKGGQWMKLLINNKNIHAYLWLVTWITWNWSTSVISKEQIWISELGSKARLPLWLPLQDGMLELLITYLKDKSILLSKISMDLLQQEKLK
jgi:hypothetical protein